MQPSNHQHHPHSQSHPQQNDRRDYRRAATQQQQQQQQNQRSSSSYSRGRGAMRGGFGQPGNRGGGMYMYVN